jgi:hypothetical protein
MASEGLARNIPEWAIARWSKQTILSSSPDKTVPYDSHERIDPVSPRPLPDRGRVVAVCLRGIFLGTE